MNESQGPTPAGTSRPYRNLPDALRAHRIDPVNHDFITAITDTVGISSFIDRGRYIEAIRNDGGTTLHIGKTYTNGFAENEILVFGGAALRLQASEGRAPHFYVTHPSEFIVTAPTKTARTTSRTATPRVAASERVTATKLLEREYGVCEECFMTRTASGTCGC